MVDETPKTVLVYEKKYPNRVVFMQSPSFPLTDRYTAKETARYMKIVVIVTNLLVITCEPIMHLTHLVWL